MKKILTTAMLMTVYIQANAQVSFSPAIRAGINLSNITEMESSYRTGFYVGVAGGINLTKVYTLQPEFTFSQQGNADARLSYYNYETNETTFDSADLQLNYLSIAMMNRFNIADGFNVGVGPYLDFLISDNMMTRDTDADTGFMAGFGYKSPSGFAFEARVKKGIADVVSNEFYEGGNGFFFGDYNTNLVFQIGAAYYFDLGKTEPDAK